MLPLADDIVDDFGTQDDGLVIGTVDLFRAAIAGPESAGVVRDALLQGRGRFRWPPIP